MALSSVLVVVFSQLSQTLTKFIAQSSLGSLVKVICSDFGRWESAGSYGAVSYLSRRRRMSTSSSPSYSARQILSVSVELGHGKR
jgi:hypothetical protein